MTRSVYTTRYATLKRLVLEARQRAGLTQADVARRLRKPQSYISKVEAGERRIDVVELLDLMDVLGGDAVAVVKAVAEARTPKGKKR